MVAYLLREEPLGRGSDEGHLNDEANKCLAGSSDCGHNAPMAVTVLLPVVRCIMPNNTLLVGLLSAASALAGVVVAGIIQFRISQQAYKELLEQNDQNFAHAMRRERRTRMLQYVASIYAAANAHVTVAEELSSHKLLPASQPHLTDNPLLAELRQANMRAQDALVMLAFEGSNEPIIDTYKDVRVAFDTYRRVGQTQGTYDMAELHAAVDKLQRMMSVSYGGLEALS
jgi:hypothetical protein